MRSASTGRATRAERVALALIRVYKITLSPLFAGSCRYTPGCADYMSESITRFGVMRGAWLGTRRLCRCHPFGGHGYDPVPQSLGPDHISRWNAESS
jgi:putative membrane protein insertion efficiency factor